MLTTEQVLSLVIIILVIIVGGLLYARFFRPPRRLPAASLPPLPAEPSPAAPQPPGNVDLRAYRQEVDSLRRQLAQVQEEVSQLRQSLGGRPVAAQGNANYNQAIEMAQQGQSVANVAGRCGISRAEAELIVAMHRNQGAR